MSRLQPIVSQKRPTTGPDPSVPSTGRGHRFHHEAFSYYDRLTPVLQFVTAHLAKPISLEDAAKLAGLERKYFSVFFHSKVGLTFTEWIRILRVEFGFSYTFTADDAQIGKVTFRAVAVISGARDALPADNEAIAPPTKVSR